MHSKRKYWTIAKVRVFSSNNEFAYQHSLYIVNTNVDPQLSVYVKEVDDIEMLLYEVNDDHSKFKTILK